ncbi:MAG: YeeE/YedE family protein [Betaproteobacteria bacterium]|nr:MAG: YeeE/YedE family protein [Betaproteobacteria bacterium]
MEFNVHHQVLTAVFAVAVVLGAVVNKTNFCTMGAVSDWVNMGDSGRMRAWLLAMAIAIAGVTVLETAGMVSLAGETFPPYRTANFGWLRYLVGGALFGIGMTLGSGCGNKTLVRVGAGNLKSLVVLAIAASMAYLMLWTPFYEKLFHPWVSATTIDLAQHGVNSQELGAVIAGMFRLQPSRNLNAAVGALLALALFIHVFRSADFRGSFDNLLGGAAVGLAVLVGWYLTGGPLGQAWKEYAEFATQVPSRVQVQSYTFISPMGDTVRYLLNPGTTTLVNFGVVALAGVIFGSFIYALVAKSFRLEWFVSVKDFANHAVGGMLMGVGGVLAMGCTVGQAITGMSTLAIGSMLTFLAIVIGAAGTMKYQYWRMMQEA